MQAELANDVFEYLIFSDGKKSTNQNVYNTQRLRITLSRLNTNAPNKD